MHHPQSASNGADAGTSTQQVLQDTRPRRVKLLRLCLYARPPWRWPHGGNLTNSHTLKIRRPSVLTPGKYPASLSQLRILRSNYEYGTPLHVTGVSFALKCCAAASPLSPQCSSRVMASSHRLRCGGLAHGGCSEPPLRCCRTGAALLLCCERGAKPHTKHPKDPRV